MQGLCTWPSLDSLSAANPYSTGLLLLLEIFNFIWVFSCLPPSGERHSWCPSQNLERILVIKIPVAQSLCLFVQNWRMPILPGILSFTVTLPVVWLPGVTCHSLSRTSFHIAFFKSLCSVQSSGTGNGRLLHGRLLSTSLFNNKIDSILKSVCPG